MLHTETVSAGTLDLIKKLSSDETFKDFNLVGGTALALQIGHRVSVDIDLFSRKPFDSIKVIEHLRQNYPVELVNGMDNNVAGLISGVKIQLLAHQYRDISPPIVSEGIRMASIEDIAAMKVNAIYNLGSRYKDFLDIYHILEYKSMREVLDSFKTKYPEASEQTASLALGYHKDVEGDNMIRHLRKNVSWSEISDRITGALRHNDQVFKMTRNKQKRPNEPNQILRKRRGRKR